jgi:hypothetical protein
MSDHPSLLMDGQYQRAEIIIDRSAASSWIAGLMINNIIWFARKINRERCWVMLFFLKTVFIRRDKFVCDLVFGNMRRQ